MTHLSIVKFSVTAIAVPAIILFFSYKQADEKQQLAKEMQASMVNNLLKPWYPKSFDEQYGGFVSSFSYNFTPTADQGKMIVTQARHTWSNSKAAEMFPEVAYYQHGAKHGFEYLKNVMWDKQYGGFYTYVDQRGNVKPNRFAAKEAYGNSFAIYALAAYYQLSGDTSALNLAIADFTWLDKHSHDPIFKGYFQHMERDGTPMVRDKNTPSTAELGYKDQNTSIHLLESFTELYTVWPDKHLKERLNEMFLLVRDTITTPKGYLKLYFTRNWTPVSFKDSTTSVILLHRGLDHVSFGHDVETAYLLLEASHTLGLKNDTTTLKIAKRMLDHALTNGWDAHSGGFYDEGYYFKDKPEITIIADTKNWWAQAEGLNTLLLMSDYYPTDKLHYFQKFKQLWAYVQTYLIDHENGDWYQGGIDKQPELKTALKGQIWKGTYHNLRALINCIQRLQPDKIAPTQPQNAIMVGSKTLTWRPSSDNDHVLGYNIYLNKARIGFTPLTTYKLADNIKTRQSFIIKAIDLQGNESLASEPIISK